MSRLILFSFIFMSMNNSVSFSQETINHQTKMPTEFGEFIIPLWSKIVLELKEKKKGKYEYRILSIEPHTEMYSFDKDEDLFSKNPMNNTIEIFFVGAFYNEGKEDKDYKSLLLLRNNSEVMLDYSADIKYYFNDDFENTSIIGTFPGASGREIWEHKIDFIKLYDFKLMKLK